jgi:septum formation protein
VPTLLPLVLASGSVTRKTLLERLGLAFETAVAGVDESRRPGEAPDALARRLAEAKVRALAPRFPSHLLIGADQVATLGNEVFGKPADRAAAARQLDTLGGRTVRFLSALCVLNTCSGRLHADLVEDRVTLRRLDAAAIARYLDREAPYDCAGALRSEGLGIALCERIDSSDPSALLGLPLIRLCGMLRTEGWAIP